MNGLYRFAWLRPPTVLIVMLLVASGCATAPKEQPETSERWRESLQPPLEETVRQQLASELQLSQALVLAATRNPAVQAEKERWLAAILVEPQATSLPDPMVQFGYQFDSAETRVGPQRFNTGVNQAVPWWRKLWSKGRIAAKQADMAHLRYEAAVRDLVIQVKDAYYELYYLDRASMITETIETTLNNEAVLAYQELTVGRTQLNEAFRAESWAAQLKYDRILLTEQRAAQAERLKALLNLPPDTEIGPVRRCPLYATAETIEPLYGRAEQYNELLKIRGLEAQKAAYDTYLAQLSRIPDFNVGFNIIETGPARMPNVKDSGKNPFIGLFSMNLPIWEQRTRALIKEKEAAEKAARHQAMNETNRVRMAVAQTFFAVDLSQRLASLYAETLLPQADAVMHQAEIDFRNEQASFATLIETTLAYHNFQLAYHRALADNGQAIGRLEQIVGTTVEVDAREGRD